MRIDGTEGDDSLQGTFEPDYIYGYGGNDTISGGDLRYDDVYAGDGNDMVYGGFEIYGEGGNDYLVGTNLMVGGSGNDTLIASDNSAVFDLTGGGRNFAMGGAAGDDVFYLGRGIDQVLGYEGFDTVSYNRAPSAVTVDLLNQSRNAGSAAGDRLDSIEIVSGSRFADKLYGDGDFDFLRGDNGDDQLFGRSGRDDLDGGGGTDWLNGGQGADTLRGGSGRDTATYGVATAGVTADLRSDGVRTGLNSGDAAGDVYDGIENLSGSLFADRLLGSAGANVLSGQGGADTLLGRGGADTLLGGQGSDALRGGDGADRLYGGAGVDGLFGGAGADRFMFRRGDGRDILHDFQDNVDIIQLTGLGMDSFAEARSHARQSGGDVIFDFGDGNILIVADTTISQLADDMILG